MTGRTKLGVEAMEAREVPAILVSPLTSGGELVLTTSPPLRPTAVWVADMDDAVGWRETDEGRELRIRVPPAAGDQMSFL